jgi:hypothetical protein
MVLFGTKDWGYDDNIADTKNRSSKNEKLKSPMNTRIERF